MAALGKRKGDEAANNNVRNLVLCTPTFLFFMVVPIAEKMLFWVGFTPFAYRHSLLPYFVHFLLLLHSWW